MCKDGRTICIVVFATILGLPLPAAEAHILALGGAENIGDDHMYFLLVQLASEEELAYATDLPSDCLWEYDPLPFEDLAVGTGWSFIPAPTGALFGQLLPKWDHALRKLEATLNDYRYYLTTVPPGKCAEQLHIIGFSDGASTISAGLNLGSFWGFDGIETPWQGLGTIGLIDEVRYFNSVCPNIELDTADVTPNWQYPVMRYENLTNLSPGLDNIPCNPFQWHWIGFVLASSAPPRGYQQNEWNQEFTFESVWHENFPGEPIVFNKLAEAIVTSTSALIKEHNLLGDCVCDPSLQAGACCSAADSTCTDGVGDADCSFQGGTYQGNSTTCGATTCPKIRYHNVIDPLTTITSAGSGMALADDIELSGAGGGELVYYDLAVLGNGGGDFDVTAGLYTNCPGSGGTLIPGTQVTWSGNPDDGSPVFLRAYPASIAIPNDIWMVAEFSTSQAAWFIAEEAEIGSTDDLFARETTSWQCNLAYSSGTYAGFWANIGCAVECDDNGDCNDGLLCTTDSCELSTGSCIHAPINCNDSNACTVDSCNPGTGACVHTPISCNDNNLCTTDSCNMTTGCVNTPITCNDNSACTTDSCNPATGACVYTPITCNDNNACTTNSCNMSTGCVYTPITCNDGNACTADSCVPTTGCSYAPIVCDDGFYCNGLETCVGGVCQAGTPPCPSPQACNEATNACYSCLTNADCSDGLYCNGPETCNNGTCSAAPMPPCVAGQVCDEAHDDCEGCGAPGTGDCFDPNGHSTPFCSSELCCQEVCTFDEFCCTGAWDDICAAAAVGICIKVYDPTLDVFPFAGTAAGREPLIGAAFGLIDSGCSPHGGMMYVDKGFEVVQITPSGEEQPYTAPFGPFPNGVGGIEIAGTRTDLLGQPTEIWGAGTSMFAAESEVVHMVAPGGDWQPFSTPQPDVFGMASVQCDRTPGLLYGGLIYISGGAGIGYPPGSVSPDTLFTMNIVGQIEPFAQLPASGATHFTFDNRAGISPFGFDRLWVSSRTTDTVYSVTPNGFANPPLVSLSGKLQGLAFGHGDAVFGSDLYVGNGSGTIRKVMPDGTVSVFAEGFPSASYLMFVTEGTYAVGGQPSLYVLDGVGSIWVVQLIQPPPQPNVEYDCNGNAILDECELTTPRNPAAFRGVNEGSGTITLTPASAISPLRTDHTVTATVVENGSPVQNTLVQFGITSGPNAFLDGMDTTDVDGKATFTYSGDGGLGIDTIMAYYEDSEGVIQASNEALKEWGSTDCNSNGTVDDCDIMACPPASPCCGDCDADWVMNICAIDNCPPCDPSCRDCNENCIPDGCDIASGAYQDSPPNGIPDVCQNCHAADFNDSGSVNASDLALLLGAWGSCGVSNCPPGGPDINVDCVVNASDLARLLGYWGPCP